MTDLTQIRVFLPPKKNLLNNNNNNNSYQRSQAMLLKKICPRNKILLPIILLIMIISKANQITNILFNKIQTSQINNNPHHLQHKSLTNSRQIS